MTLRTARGDKAYEPFLTLQWRYDELRKAGYPIGEALEIAERSDIDLHRACSLSLAGCPLERAMAILR